MRVLRMPSAITFLALFVAPLSAQTYAGEQCTNYNYNYGSTLSCTLSVPTSGDAIFVYGLTQYGTAAPTGLTDSGTHSAVVSVTGAVGYTNLWVVTNAASGSHTLTMSTSSGYPIISAIVISGASTASPVDNYGIGVQQDNYACSVSTTTTNAGELILEFDNGGAGTITSSTPAMASMISNYQAAINALYGSFASSGTAHVSWNYVDNGYNYCDLVAVTATAVPLATTTTSLPNAIVGQPYDFCLAARGGQLPYSWSLEAGTLPSSLTLGTNGCITGTVASVGTESGLEFKVTDAASHTATTPSMTLTTVEPPPSITTSSVPSGTQYEAYSTTLDGTCGNPPCTWSWSTSSSYDALPEGLTLDASTGDITGSKVMGMGIYNPEIIYTDSTGQTATEVIPFSIAGNTSFLATSPFPSNSIWTQNVSSLPVDTSPAVSSGLPAVRLVPVFGANVDDGGIPVIKVPSTQAFVPMSVTQGGYSMFTSAPFPNDTPIEGTSNRSSATTYIGDGHANVVLLSSAGVPASAWETYNTQYVGGASDAWESVSQGYYSFSNYTLYSQDNGEGTDAAGLPVGTLLLNYDAVMSTGGQQSVVRFSIGNSRTLNYHYWPATAQAGGGSCSGGYEDDNRLVSQLDPPTNCSSGRVAFGSIWRLKASVANPCTGNPQSTSIINTLRNYGMILADNGSSSFVGLIGTTDSRWDDTDLSCLSNLTGADFEPVMVQQLAVSGGWPNSSEVSTSTPSDAKTK